MRTRLQRTVQRIRRAFVGRSISGQRATWLTPDCENHIKRLSKLDDKIEATVREKLEHWASRGDTPRDQIPGLGGLPVFKVRIKLGNRMAGRFIMLISETHVVGVAVYAKNQKENMPADEIVDLLEEAASDRP